MRALYRAARDGARLSVMFPMVTSVQELLALRARPASGCAPNWTPRSCRWAS